MQKEECLGPVELKDDEDESDNLRENGNTEVRCKDFWSYQHNEQIETNNNLREGIQCNRLLFNSYYDMQPIFFLILQGSGFSMEKLRQYQLNRLKYYYAVMDCDSPGMA